MGKLSAGIFGGLLVAVTGAALVTLATVDIQTGESDAVKAFLGFWAFGFVIAVVAPYPAKSWSRLLIVSGILALALPVASLVFTTREAPDAALIGSEYAAAAAKAAGASLDGKQDAMVLKGSKYLGRIVTYLAGFLGVVFGAAFIMIGVLIGLAKPAAKQPPAAAGKD